MIYVNWYTLDLDYLQPDSEDTTIKNTEGTIIQLIYIYPYLINQVCRKQVLSKTCRQNVSNLMHLLYSMMSAN